MNNMRLKRKILMIWFVGISIILILFPVQIESKSAKTLIRNKIIIEVGKTKKITLGTEKNIKYKYKSNNKKIVVASKEGTFLGKKKGVTNVSVYNKEGKFIQKICVCAISKVKIVVFNSHMKMCKVGEKVSVKPNIVPKNVNNKGLKWISSNTSIASVSSKGIINARKKGNVTITALATDGSKKKDSYKLMVIGKVKSIILENGNKSVFIRKEEKRKLIYHPRPANAENKRVRWKSSDSRIAFVNEYGEVVGTGNGQAIITVTSLENGKAMDTILVNVVSLSKDDIHFIAHRGLSSEAPENTLEAFRQACEASFWGTECDIYKTKDNQFVISHDPTLERMCGVNQNISELTLGEIQSYPIVTGNKVNEYGKQVMPSLGQYLQLLSWYSGIHAVIEIKDNNISDEDATRIKNEIYYYGMEDRTFIISTSQSNLLKVQSVDTEKKLSYQLVVDTPTLKLKQWCDSNYTGMTSDYNKIELAINMGMLPAQLGVWSVDDFNKACQIVSSKKCGYLTTDVKLFDD